MMPFGDVLKKLRKQNDLTQNQLGTVLGISESTVGMYERGQREPSFEMLEAIADYFNVDMDFLTGRSNIQRKYSFSPSISDSTVRKPDPSESELSSEERVLVSSWRQASEDDREVVVAALRKYGMRYQEDQRSTNAG